MDNHSITNIAAVSWRDYLALCKLKVVYLIVFTAMVGMFLATPGMVPLDTFVFATLGIGLAASCASVLNHVVDHQIDAKMTRTMRRPLPKGNVSVINAVIFAWFLGTISMGVLAFLINPLTAALTALSIIGYSFIYSMFLKRATPQNIVIGGTSGAAPPVLGWCAVTATLDANSLLLFLIIFTWTPPHFWALAIYRRDEYAAVNIPMLPVTHGVEFTRLHILLYTIILCITTVLPYLVQMSGLFYMFCALLLNVWFMYYVIRMQFDHSDCLAMKIFNVSITYLMLLFAALLLDHYIPVIARAIA